MKFAIEIRRSVSAVMVVDAPDGTEASKLYRLMRNSEFASLAHDAIEDGWPDDTEIDCVRAATESEIETYDVDFVFPTPIKGAP
jgi:hypothetical protein